LGTGSFVGLEVDERTELHPDILWTDGVLNGVAYFGETLLEKRRGVFVRPKQVMYLL
jgi:dynactin complex subunit